MFFFLQILWFETECPTRFSFYENPNTLRDIFIKQKIEELSPKKPILQKSQTQKKK